MEDKNKKTQSLLKEIQDAMDVMKNQGQEGGRGARGVGNNGCGRGRGNSNDREFFNNFNGRCSLRGQCRGRGSYNNNLGNQGKPLVLKIKTKPLVMAMLISLPVKITKAEEVHSASIIKGMVQISIFGHFSALG